MSMFHGPRWDRFAPWNSRSREHGISMSAVSQASSSHQPDPLASMGDHTPRNRSPRTIALSSPLHKPYKEILSVELFGDQKTCHRLNFASPELSDDPKFSSDARYKKIRKNGAFGNALDNTIGEHFNQDPLSQFTRDLLKPQHNNGYLGRFVNHKPYRVLNAPGLVDDFYLNLIDWSSKNVVAVVLGDTIHLWNNQIQQLEGGPSSSLNNKNPIPSASWTALHWHIDGNLLALGTRQGNLEIWDCEKGKMVQSWKQAHKSRIDIMHWNEALGLLSTGGKDHLIHHFDMRVPSSDHIGALVGHKQEVCGLKWQQQRPSIGTYANSSGSGRQGSSFLLASGGNDNVICIWDVRKSLGLRDNIFAGGNASHEDAQSPLFLLKAHEAAVKAMDWCPLRKDWLATGGGTLDRKLVLWDMQRLMDENSNVGSSLAPLCKIDTASQVCNMTWSLCASGGLELVTSHGYTQNQLILWKVDELVPGKMDGMPSFSSIAAFAAGSTDTFEPFGDTVSTWPSSFTEALGPTALRNASFGRTSLSSHQNVSLPLSSLLGSGYRSSAVDGPRSKNIPGQKMTQESYRRWSPILQMNGHSNRVIHMARDPRGENIITGSADETLRFWKVFAPGSILIPKDKDKVHIERGSVVHSNSCSDSEEDLVSIKPQPQYKQSASLYHEQTQHQWTASLYAQKRNTHEKGMIR
jgi:WD40 repeat protein